MHSAHRPSRLKWCDRVQTQALKTAQSNAAAGSHSYREIKTLWFYYYTFSECSDDLCVIVASLTGDF